MADIKDLAGKWEIDATHSSIGFSVRHAMVAKVRGTFNDFAGAFEVDGDDVTKSTAAVTLQAASIDTRSADRDGHLKSADFLDVDNHKTLDFTSTSVAVDGNDLTVTGDLTIRGTTKPVTVELEFLGTSVDPYGNTRAGFEGSAKINRKDFGLTFNIPLDGGGVMVGDDIKLNFDIEAIKQAA